MGDATDNVIGIKGIGPAKTAKILPLELSDTYCNKNLQNHLDNTVKEYYISSGRLADFAKNKQLLKMVTNLEVPL
jgi:5'-3' exonuclease